MSNPLERAARAVYAVELARDENCNSLIIKLGGNPHPSTRIEAFEESPVQWGEYARAAILAFLDADEAMVERVARALEYEWETNPDCPGEMYRNEARDLATAAIAALRDMLEEKK